MRRQRKGFLLIESLMALAIALLIVTTMTVTVTAEFEKLRDLEAKTTSHKLMLQRLTNTDLPNQVTINGKRYSIQQNSHNIKILNQKNKSFELKW
ncbi:hypothetical protein [Companilactobacillus ginsenosidimutans]|uniref:Competence protein ComGE n=1 Tax=Companilactobacillus ginsenosidimutans TaxID=1007676 RepID=A0A0H4QMD4_9LACO|nr:hypothetical protein [Companilactobacillus ginsenosidimutans]AKP68271.1 hypothetical protein ABM34_12480 [Companilactobacillus ginsenosidimutans]